MKRASPVNRGSAYRIQVLDLAFGILKAIAENGSDVGLAELSARLGLHKSTTHRLLMVLENDHFVERCPVSGKYHLGSRLIDLGQAALARLDVFELARPHLRELAEETAETAHLAVLRGGEVVSLVNAESRQTLRTPATVGTRSPAHCTSLGKTMLAFLPPEQVDEFLRQHVLEAYTRRTITSPAKFRTELRMIRERGYAVDNEEREEGLRCIGAPVRDHTGAVIAAVSIAGPAFRIRADRVSTLALSVVRAAARISLSLGYRRQDRG